MKLTEADLRQMISRRDGPKAMRSAKRSKIVPWTATEDASLREMYANSTRAEIAAALNRSTGAVNSRCWTLGLKTKEIPWSNGEISKLREAYSRGSASEIDAAGLAVDLGRSVDAVHVKASRLGLADIARKKVPQRKRRRRFDTEEDLRAHQSQAARDRIALNGHPRGALGMKHTEEAKARVSEANRRAWADPQSGFHRPENRQALSDRMLALNLARGAENNYSRTAGGRRADLGGLYLRSSWEANYARYLSLLRSRGEIRSWDYESRTFLFEAITRGARSYTPDFRVVFLDGRVEWHEVKGWLDPKSQTKLTRMQRYFPNEIVRVIDKEWFASVRRSGLAGAIQGWEFGGSYARRMAERLRQGGLFP